jgi:enoyl-CoA hydratase/carnithine racemase
LYRTRRAGGIKWSSWLTIATSIDNFKLERTAEGVLTVVFHTDGGPIAWNLRTLEELGYLWGDAGSDPDNKVIIVTGTGDGFIPSLAVEEWRADVPRWLGEDRDRRQANDPEPPGDRRARDCRAVNGPARLHSEEALLCDIVIASSDAEFQDSPHCRVRHGAR